MTLLLRESLALLAGAGLWLLLALLLATAGVWLLAAVARQALRRSPVRLSQLVGDMIAGVRAL